MIAYLKGRLTEKTAGSCIIDVGGVGFRMSLSTTSLSSLPAEGNTATVHVHLYVREDELSLYGFASTEERELFEHLLTVSGVGPKVALATLSSFTPSALSEAIAREDVGLISSVPGIGKKTAQRIILDLKDRLALPDLAAAAIGIGADVVAEATEALLAMGFSSAEVATALKGYDGDPDNAQALLKHALRRLGGGV